MIYSIICCIVLYGIYDFWKNTVAEKIAVKTNVYIYPIRVYCIISLIQQAYQYICYNGI